jgi:HSP20 family protein
MAWSIGPRRRGAEIMRRGDYDDPISSLQRAMNSLFEDFVRTEMDWPRPLGSSESGSASNTFSPRCDVCETDKDLQIVAEMPGIDPKDVRLSVQDNILSIEGEKRVQRDENKNRYQLSERSFGYFRRDIPLPQGIDENAIKAKFHEGVLTIVAPKTAEAQRRGKAIPIAT